MRQLPELCLQQFYVEFAKTLPTRFKVFTKPKLLSPRIRGAVFEWLAPLSVALLIVTGAGSIGYIFYSKQKLARLKQRCSSPGVSDTGTIFGKLI